MDSSTEVAENVDFTKLKVPELKKELKSRGLSTAGNKTELLERLQNASKSKPDETMSAASVDDLGDLQDLLNDEDDEHIDESELTELDANLVTTPKSVKRKSSDSSVGGGDAPKQPKKIVLNRTVSSTDEALDDGAPSPVKKDEPVVDDAGDKKVIKLSQLSTKERLEMRAKKFGMPLTVDAKLVARAERFGVAEKTTSATIPMIQSVWRVFFLYLRNVTENVQEEREVDKSEPLTLRLTDGLICEFVHITCTFQEHITVRLRGGSAFADESSATASLDVLKQRAERFGVNVSTALSKLEQEQRLEKRKERFGATANGNGKLQERAERFKQPVK